MYSGAPSSDIRSCGHGVVLLKQVPKSAKLQPLWGGFSQVSPATSGKPTIIRGASRTLIQVPIRAEGTGAMQDDGLLAWTGGSVHEIDTHSYESELKSRLPKGLFINKGLYPDYAKMALSTDVWKSDDPNCCPSGGKVRAALDIKDDRVVLKSFNLDQRPAR